jgi:hypothetical protein
MLRCALLGLLFREYLRAEDRPCFSGTPPLRKAAARCQHTLADLVLIRFVGLLSNHSA